MPTDDVPPPQLSPTNEPPEVSQHSPTDEPANTDIPAANTQETPFKGSAPVVKEQGSLLIGAEVILGLVALGAGFAWLILRRRGG
jgi:uncharacterized membrane protein